VKEGDRTVGIWLAGQVQIFYFKCQWV